MIYVDRSSQLPPPIFHSTKMDRAHKSIKDFYEQDSSLRRQNRYSYSGDSDLRKEFLPALRQEFSGKCAYCESVINLAFAHSVYDHFRPKHSARGFDNESSDDHYWWLVYEWGNLYYSCSKCNTFKSSWFPVDGPRAPVNVSLAELQSVEQAVLVDPCNDDPSAHFAYDAKGEMIGITPRGLATIELIKLNRIELVEQRLIALSNLEANFEIFESILKKEESNLSRVQTFFDQWRVIYSDTNANPYLGIQRYFLKVWLDKYEFFDYLMNRKFTVTDKIKPDKVEKLTPTVITFDHEMPEQTFTDIKDKIDKVKHIFVESIEIKNFKCFSELNLQFNNMETASDATINADDQAVAPWILFLGENGVGKSSLLKAFSIGLAGREYIKLLDIKGSDLLKSGEESGFIKLHLVGGVNPVTVTFTANEIICNNYLPLVNFVAYNAIRLKSTPPAIVPEKNEFFGARAENLFNYTASLIDSDDWLKNQTGENFDRVALTLKDLMSLGDDEQIIISGGRASLKRGDKTLFIDELSDGYQAIFHMAIDIMATMQKDGLPYEVAEGMVLIDEIGAHLHPRWRMEVVRKLRRAFPKMRFVVSTHEPLCLRGMKSGETVVLQKDEEHHVYAITNLPNPAELRIDQILTSDFFGLNSTMDSETEQLFNEYYTLLAQKQEELTEDEIDRLKEIKAKLPKTRYIGDNIRESIIYDVVDQLLADKKANDPFKNIAAITEEAFQRLRKTWDLN